MSKHGSRKQAKRESAASRAAPVDSLFDAARSLALGGLAALLVATPLIPSEGAADLGTGVMLLMLWFVLLTGWLAVTVLQKPPVFRLAWPDAAVAIFFGLVGLSAFITVSEGYARATINMTWRWLSFGVCYFLTRQLLRTRAETRAICSVMIGLAVCLSALSFHQVFYGLPEARAAYEQNPEAMLREAGIDSTEGSPERRLFEDRLGSTEPTATFALANSLAGLLAPWLVLCVGIGVTVERRQGTGARTLIAAGSIALCIGFCLMLTKSRSAVLAVTTAVALLSLWRWRRGRTLDWRVLAAGVTAAAVLAIAVVVAGLFDRLVLTEAPKSVLYRFQYWESTAEMIADHPWFGCGPGNFQQFYVQYKLPEASESISDPHNLLFEVWSTMGTPALLTLLVLLAALGRCVWGGNGVGSGQENSESSSCASMGPRPIYAGAGVGLLLGYLAATASGFSPDFTLLWLGFPAATLAVYGLHRWTLAGGMPVAVCAFAWLALTVNLLAAGGISFAGVALSWWLLAAIIISRTRPDPFRAATRSVGVVAMLVCLSLALGCYWTMYRPVLACQAALSEGVAALREGEFERAEAAYRRAARSDPYSAEPWMHLAAMYIGEVRASGTPDRLAEFEQVAQEAIVRRGGAHTAFRQLGNWRLELYARLNDSAQLQKSLDAYRRVVQLYPNSSLAHAQLAWALHLAGDTGAAVTSANRALELDERNPHRERKLAEQQVFDPTGRMGDAGDAEQLMHRLRR